MARPAILCKLKKGTLIGANDGFVDTFNWMVDYINNLRGDDDNIKIENPTGSNPVVKYIGESGDGGDGSFDVVCKDSDGNQTTTTVNGTLTLQPGYDTNIIFTAMPDGIVAVDVKYK